MLDFKRILNGGCEEDVNLTVMTKGNEKKHKFFFVPTFFIIKFVKM